MEVENTTPFMADRYGVSDRDGADLLLVVLKGTYALGAQGHLTVADEQQPIELVDDYVGEPGTSSVRYASDFSIGKPGTDIAVLGHAYPARPGQAEANVGIQVGAVQKLVRVFGERRWSRTMGLTNMTRPAPFQRIPLTYEHAFGGADQSHPDERLHEYEARNPVGVGFRAKKSTLPIDGALLPNVEDPRHLISSPEDCPPPAGFGFIGPAWQPRLGYAGTYAAGWEQSRKPLLPDDFSERFFNAAHPDLVVPGFLQGNEAVNAIGVSPEGPISFALPGVRPQCVVEVEHEGKYPVVLHLDKVVLEPDDARLLLVWSGTQRAPMSYEDFGSVTFSLQT